MDRTRRQLQEFKNYFVCVSYSDCVYAYVSAFDMLPNLKLVVHVAVTLKIRVNGCQTLPHQKIGTFDMLPKKIHVKPHQTCGVAKLRCHPNRP
jgi:hypothetical protein